MMGELDWPDGGSETGLLDVGGRYRVDVLAWAEVGADGVRFREGAEPLVLEWDRVLHALAAHVGEPEGVSTVVFDLVVERKEADCLVCRFDADPGEASQSTARTLAERLGRGRCSRSLLELAAEGVPTRSYPDLDALAAGSLEELGY
jgi:hypothetical protein